MQKKGFLISINEDFYSKAKKFITLVFSLIIVYLFINDFLVYKNVFHFSTGSFLENYLYTMDLSKAPYIILLSLVIFVFLIWIFFMYFIIFSIVKCNLLNIIYSFFYNCFVVFFSIQLIISQNLFNFIVEFFSLSELNVIILVFIILFVIQNIVLLIWCVLKIDINKLLNIFIFFLFVVIMILISLKSIVMAFSVYINTLLYFILYYILIVFNNKSDTKQLQLNKRFKSNIIEIALIIFTLSYGFYMFLFFSIENYQDWYKNINNKILSFNLFLNTAFIKKTKSFNLENGNPIILNATSPDCNISKINMSSCYIPFSSNEKIFFQKSDDFNKTHKICVVILQLKEVQYNFFKKFSLGDKNLINETSSYEILDIGYIKVKNKKFNLCNRD